MGSGKIKILKDIARNFLSNGKYNLSYVTELANWSIKADGEYITQSLNSQKLLTARVTSTFLGLRNQIIHFGSVNTFLKENGFVKLHKSNKLVLTWFHFVPEDKKNKYILEAQKYLSFIHTSCQKTKKQLIELGVKKNKIVVIPLGVDLDLFKPASAKEKQEIKRELSIPKDKIVIGSFQKDGVGWGRGLEPKMIKGPDIFVRVMGELSKRYPVFVLLVGPSRGYMENELKKRGVPFKSIGYLKNFKDIGKYYKALDLYLITSRIEGGPKQILEAWASGVPVVATKVGMIPDIVIDEKNVLITNIEDVKNIKDKTIQIITSDRLKEKLVNNGIQSAKNYSWRKISQFYCDKIYSRL